MHLKGGIIHLSCMRIMAFICLNLRPFQRLRNFIKNMQNRGVLSKEVRDIVLNIREEMKKEEEHEQDHYYGMTR